MMGWKVVKWGSVGVLAVSSAMLLEITFNPLIVDSFTPVLGVVVSTIGSAFLYGVAKAEIRDREDDA